MSTVPGHPNVKIQVLSDGEGCEFLLRGFDLKEVAKIRRIFYSSLQTMAIDLLEFEENTTGFADETISHRLGLIPIKCEDTEDLPMVNDCEGCPEDESPPIEDCLHCGVEFELEESLPLSSRTERKEITEEDIVFKDGQCTPQTSGTPLFLLRPGERISITGLVQKGVGSIHAKWIPVAAVRFEHPEDDLYVFTIDTTGQLDCDEIISQAMDIFEAQQ